MGWRIAYFHISCVSSFWIDRAEGGFPSSGGLKQYCEHVASKFCFDCECCETISQNWRHTKSENLSFLTPNSNLTNAQHVEKDRIGARSLRGEIGRCVWMWKLISSMETKPKHDRQANVTFTRCPRNCFWLRRKQKRRQRRNVEVGGTGWNGGLNATGNPVDVTLLEGMYLLVLW